MFRLSRYALLAASVAFSALTLFSFALTIEQYFKPAPVFFSADDLRLLQLPQIVKPGSTVLLGNREEIQHVPIALAAYALRDFPLKGRVKTGYGLLDEAAKGEVYDYALLARGEDPAGRGYDAEAIWTNGKFALYPRAPGVLVHQNLDKQSAFYAPLDLLLGTTGVLTDTLTATAQAETRGVNIALALLQPQTATIAVGDWRDEVQLQPGLSVYHIPVLPLPSHLTISAGDLTIPWVELTSIGERGPATVTKSDALLIQCANDNPDTLNDSCQIANPASANLRWEWVVRGTTKGSDEDQLFFQRAATGSPMRSIKLAAGFREGLMSLQFDDQPPVRLQPDRKLGDGEYRISLDVYRGQILVARVGLGQFMISQDSTTFKRTAGPEKDLTIARP